jgi:hypothetical protein
MSRSNNILDELKNLEATHLQMQMVEVYEVPSDYFVTLPALMLRRIKALEVAEANDEIAILSPLLASISRKMPNEVPADFFTAERANSATQTTIPVKVVSIGRKWMRYAAAAVVAAAIAISGIVIYNSNNSPEKKLAKLENRVKKDIKTTSDQELNDFIESTEGRQDVAINKPKDVAPVVLKDVPATELQDFLDEISDPDAATDDKSAME